MNTSWASYSGKCSMVYKRLMLILHSNEPFVHQHHSIPHLGWPHRGSAPGFGFLGVIAALEVWRAAVWRQTRGERRRSLFAWVIAATDIGGLGVVLLREGDCPRHFQWWGGRFGESHLAPEKAADSLCSSHCMLFNGQKIVRGAAYCLGIVLLFENTFVRCQELRLHVVRARVASGRA
jgi:hypothetical protein